MCLNRNDKHIYIYIWTHKCMHVWYKLFRTPERNTVCSLYSWYSSGDTCKGLYAGIPSELQESNHSSFHTGKLTYYLVGRCSSQKLLFSHFQSKKKPKKPTPKPQENMFSIKIYTNHFFLANSSLDSCCCNVLLETVCVLGIHLKRGYLMNVIEIVKKRL